MDVLSGIVRIRSNKGIGTGFVVSDDGLIVTCAHVLGLSMPEKTLVMFQATGEEQEATVLPDDWRNVGAEDVAFLRIPGPLPDGVQPLPLGSSKGIEGHPMMSFGYPKTGEVERGRATGKILGWGAKTETGQPLLQVHSSEIKEGFSGAPIWDEVRQRVVGMVAIAARQGDTAYATPTETLRAVSSALQLNDRCPYRSLEAFTEKDAAFFFGRQRVIEQLMNNLQHEPCFLAVFGASGSGKSSVVQAGLIPRLRDGALPGNDRWEIIVTRPAATDPPFRQLLASLDRPSDRTSTRVAFVIDQFEELFDDEDTSSEIITQMAQLLENTPRVTLLIVMRSDFFSLLMRGKTLEKWVPRCVVNVWPPLDREEVEAIVRQPAECLGWRFEGGLVEMIVKDVLGTPTKARKKVGSETMLPLLEFALTQLWERRQDGMLTADAYRRIGGITGGLSTWADDTYRSFEEKLRPLVRRIFTSLVHLGDKEQNIVDSRRRRPLSELIYCDAEKADVSQIVERLVAKRLLVKDQKGAQEVVEIIHDALLWEWGRLKEWLEDEEDRKFLLWHQELEQRVRAWIGADSGDPAGRDPERLLRGSDLTKALGWVRTREQDLSQEERKFIEAGKARQEQEERNKKRVTRRTVLGYGLAGLGLVATGYLLLSRNGPSLKPVSLPYSYSGHTNAVNSVAWSPDGKRLASASDDGTVQVGDAVSGTRLLTYSGHADAVNSVAWSPDGKRLASGSADFNVQVWDAVSGTRLLTYSGHTNPVNSVAWSPGWQAPGLRQR